ncbi:MAG: T9SS type A sorting domain-containing protein, partial [Bacteroidales bacterium]
ALYRILVVNPMPNIFILTITNSSKYIEDYYINSVDYDGSNDKFVVSASQLPIPNDTNYIRNQIIAHIDNNSQFPSNTFTTHQLEIDTNFALLDRTSKVFLEGNHFYYTGNAFLVHDVYSINDLSDGFWLTKINYLTGSIDQTRVYIAQDNYLYKILVGDAVDNFDKIFVLGTFVSNKLPINEVKRCVLQIDASNYNSAILKAMDDYDIVNISPLYPPHPPHYTKLHPMGYLNGLIFNNLYYDIIGFGSIFKMYSYLVEVMDLNYSGDGCEHEVSLNIYTPEVIVNNPTYQTLGEFPTLTSALPVEIYGTYALTWETLCSYLPKSTEYFDNGRKENIQRIINENMEKYPQKKALLKDIKAPARIQVSNNKFVCVNFEGKCKFIIYDAKGNIAQSGTTKNYELNNIEIKTNGMYLITVSDENNNTISNKIIINN